MYLSILLCGFSMGPVIKEQLIHISYLYIQLPRVLLVRERNYGYLMRISCATYLSEFINFDMESTNISTNISYHRV